MADKIPKVVAGYIPARNNAPEGTSCQTCRDFIRSSSECVILDPATVSGPSGTCCYYVHGKPHYYTNPLRILPASVAGYTEGKPDVPTFCGKCEYYEHRDRALSTCQKVGDHPDDTVEFGGCCNDYHVDKK